MQTLQKSSKITIFFAFVNYLLSACYKLDSKRALTRDLKGVNKTVKGHLLQALRALIKF